MTRARWLAAAALLSAATSAHAADRERAREAYDRGTAAHKRGELAKAAEEFALADQLAPSPIALKAAIDEAVRADEAAMGMELVERSRRSVVDGDLAKSVETATARFRGHAGRVRVRCPSSATCMATLDGKTLDVAKPAWTTTGQHTVVVQIDGDAQQRLVDVLADDTTDVTPTSRASSTPAPAPELPGPVASAGPREALAAPAPYPPVTEAAPPRSQGVPPVVFFVGVAATAALGGVTIWSALDTKSRHDSFANGGCANVGSPACDALSSDGSSAQTRTLVLLGATAVVGVATLVIGAAFTGWSSPAAPTKATISLRPAPQGYVLQF